MTLEGAGAGGQEALKRKNALAQGKKLFTCTWPNCGAALPLPDRAAAGGWGGRRGGCKRRGMRVGWRECEEREASGLACVGRGGIVGPTVRECGRNGRGDRCGVWHCP